MGKLLKIRDWVWRNKELMVLIVLVLSLCYQVYKVVYPEKPEELVRRPLPKPEIPQEWPGGPEAPPYLPEMAEKMPYDALLRANPFTVFGGAVEESPDRAVESSESTAVLYKIMTWKEGRYRAELGTSTGRKKYCEEGDTFGEGDDTYQVLSINADAKTVEVVSEKAGRTLVLQAP